jgi:hypothetical protein
MMRSNRRIPVHQIIRALLGLAACTEPSTRSHPLAGSYDLTTVLDSFSFETSAPSLPDCPYQGYCTHRRAFQGATLTGSMNISINPIHRDSLAAQGSFAGLMCDVVDYQHLGGCLHVAPRTDAYLTQPDYQHSYTDSTFQLLMRTDGPVETAYTRPFLFLTGTLRGDSISGEVSWLRSQGRSPPTHYGTFVGRRRP